MNRFAALALPLPLALAASGCDSSSDTSSGGSATTTKTPTKGALLWDLEVNGDSAYAYAASQADADRRCDEAVNARPANLPPEVVGVTFRKGATSWTVCLLPNAVDG